MQDVLTYTDTSAPNFSVNVSVSEHRCYNAPSNSTDLNVTEEELDSIITKVNLFVPPILIIFGNIFNILAFMVMRHKYFRNLSTSVYMSAGAVNDAVSLLISLIAHWISVNFPHVIYRGKGVGDVMCGFFNFYGWGNCDFSIIVTAAMTADRAYAIKYPLKNSSANSIKRAKIVLCVLAVIVMAKQFHFWFYSQIVPADRKDRMCDMDLSDENYCQFYHNVWPWIHIVFLTVCFITIIVSNIIIINSVRNASGKSFKNSFKNKNGNHIGDTHTRRNTRSRSKWRQITIMLVADSIALLLLTFPFSVHLAITLRMKDADLETQKINGYVFAFVLYLLYSNKCVNFCLFCMTGSRFRLALREVITCRKWRCQGSNLFTVMSRTGFHNSSCNNISMTSTPASSLKKNEQEDVSDRF